MSLPCFTVHDFPHRRPSRILRWKVCRRGSAMLDWPAQYRLQRIIIKKTLGFIIRSHSEHINSSRLCSWNPDMCRIYTTFNIGVTGIVLCVCANWCESRKRYHTSPKVTSLMVADPVPQSPSVHVTPIHSAKCTRKRIPHFSDTPAVRSSTTFNMCACMGACVWSILSNEKQSACLRDVPRVDSSLIFSNGIHVALLSDSAMSDA